MASRLRVSAPLAATHGPSVHRRAAQGLAAPWYVGSSQTRDRTCVPCVGRHILNHWTTREAPLVHLFPRLLRTVPSQGRSDFVSLPRLLSIYVGNSLSLPQGSHPPDSDSTLPHPSPSRPCGSSWLISMPWLRAVHTAWPTSAFHLL